MKALQVDGIPPELEGKVDEADKLLSEAASEARGRKALPTLYKFRATPSNPSGSQGSRIPGLGDNSEGVAPLPRPLRHPPEIAPEKNEVAGDDGRRRERGVGQEPRQPEARRQLLPRVHQGDDARAM